jgi:hypothetical protein
VCGEEVGSYLDAKVYCIIIVRMDGEYFCKPIEVNAFRASSFRFNNRLCGRGKDVASAYHRKKESRCGFL